MPVSEGAVPQNARGNEAKSGTPDDMEESPLSPEPPHSLQLMAGTETHVGKGSGIDEWCSCLMNSGELWGPVARGTWVLLLLMPCPGHGSFCASVC